MTITWLHMGAGNIFRVFIAAVQQDLIEAGMANGELAVCECFDGEIIPAVFTPYDNVTLGVTLHTDGRIEQRRITSVTEAVNCAGQGNAPARLREITADPALQIISLTITEKGYAVDEGKICPSPAAAVTAPEQLTAALLARFEAGAPPLAVVSMDNIARNGDVLKQGVFAIAKTWESAGNAPEGFGDYIQANSFPWTMIDKITPYPSEKVAELLAGDTETFPIIKTSKGTVTAHFVNAEAAQYLVMEDDFPNGCPPFDQLPPASGVYLTDRETVRKVEHMKVCACLNPLHTLLGLAGMLLDYPTIAVCMRDASLVAWARRAAAEALPVVAHPGILDPQTFLDEVLTQRFPNPFIPDTPARIVTDSSQKIPVRFGQTLQAREKAGLPADELRAIPLLAALWLRYRMGVKDDGTPLTLSPDPLAPEEVKALEGLPLGIKATALLRPVLSNAELFGVDLYAVCLGERVERLFTELASGVGAVAKVITRVKIRE